MGIVLATLLTLFMSSGWNCSIAGNNVTYCEKGFITDVIYVEVPSSEKTEILQGATLLVDIKCEVREDKIFQISIVSRAGGDIDFDVLKSFGGSLDGLSGIEFSHPSEDTFYGNFTVIGEIPEGVLDLVFDSYTASLFDEESYFAIGFKGDSALRGYCRERGM